ncbi:hypothetical protein CHS0354_042850 [Potamilus streckersoni]|uniref:Uncharacterized protein n=1 Tax=Potamilus streckersoni TaxID=2493646 RepID=A0AAE0T5G1_9BIVA|nr:hypothetical protein CHS0354_042850 [Potamilus streckersoni]
MAEAMRERASIGFQLKLNVLADLRPEGYRCIYNEFLKTVSSLNAHFRNVENLSFIHVSSLSMTSDHDINFIFEVNKDDLDLFFTACKSKVLSNSLTDYAASKNLHKKLKMDKNDKLNLSMEMECKFYNNLKASFCLESTNQKSAIKRSSEITMLECSHSNPSDKDRKKEHSFGGNGPAENYPDPIQADGSHTMIARKLPVKRASLQQNETSQHKFKCLHLDKNTSTLDISNGYVSSCS